MTLEQNIMACRLFEAIALDQTIIASRLIVLCMVKFYLNLKVSVEE